MRETSLDELADRISTFEARLFRYSKEFFPADTFTTNQMMERSSTDIRGRFLFTQLLLDILLRMERKANDKDEFITYCSKLFTNEPSNMTKLEKFHLDYEEDKIFEWYSRDSFIYRLLNKALRTVNIDQLFLCRFLLQDLASQLSVHQESSSVYVYRGQRLSRKELEDLSNQQNQYISITSFLSTSLKKNVAEFYLSQDNMNTDGSDQVSVIFEIEANPNLPGGIKPFADITGFSRFPAEEELLFMVGSIFRVTHVDITEPYSIVRMELCSNEDNSLKPLFEILRQEYKADIVTEGSQTDANSFGVVLYHMKEYDLANRFFHRIYHETSFNDPNRARYCMNIGNTILHTGRYKECAQWYDQALQLYQTNGFNNHPSVGTLYLVRGNLFSRMNQSRKALDSYDIALSMFQQSLGENHPRVALCYNAMGQLFEKRRDIPTAIDFYQKSLQIAERTSPSEHPSLITYHFCLAQAFLHPRRRDLDQALYHAQAALQIAEAISFDHATILKIHLLILDIHKQMNNVEEIAASQNSIEHLCNRYFPDFVISRDGCKSEFICSHCYRRVQIYNCFECMKNTRLYCIIFHGFTNNIYSCLQNIRYQSELN